MAFRRACFRAVGWMPKPPGFQRSGSNSESWHLPIAVPVLAAGLATGLAPPSTCKEQQPGEPTKHNLTCGRNFQGQPSIYVRSCDKNLVGLIAYDVREPLSKQEHAAWLREHMHDLMANPWLDKIIWHTACADKKAMLPSSSVEFYRLEEMHFQDYAAYKSYLSWFKDQPPILPPRTPAGKSNFHFYLLSESETILPVIPAMDAKEEARPEQVVGITWLQEHSTYTKSSGEGVVALVAYDVSESLTQEEYDQWLFGVHFHDLTSNPHVAKVVLHTVSPDKKAQLSSGAPVENVMEFDRLVVLHFHNTEAYERYVKWFEEHAIPPSRTLAGKLTFKIHLLAESESILRA